MAGSEATLGKTRGHGDWQPPGHSVFQQLHEQVYIISTSTMLLRLMINIVTATITTLCSLPLQHPSRLYDLHGHSTYCVLCPISLQPLLHPYALHCYNIYYVYKLNYYSTRQIFMPYMATAPITPLKYLLLYTVKLLLQQILHPYDLDCYSDPHVLMIYLDTATITSLWAILLQHLSRLYELYCYNT